MVLKEKLLAVAATTVFSLFSSITFAIDYIRNEPNKKVIATEHYWEFNKRENPNRYGWCGHAALQSAMSAFYPKDPNTNKRIGVPTLSQIHNQFLKIDPHSNRYGYKQSNAECQRFGYCPELNLLKEGATRFGFSTVRYNAYSELELFNGLKSIIDSGATAVVLSRTHTRNVYGTYWGDVGHFYAVHGYRTEAGKSYLYVRDPLVEHGGDATDIHEIPMNKWWEQMKIKRGSGYYVGYFSVKK